MKPFFFELLTGKFLISIFTKSKKMEQQSFLSNMTPDQAKGMIGQFSVSLLNNAGAEMGFEVRHLKMMLNLKTQKVQMIVNEKKAEKKLASIDKFEQSLKPCVMAQAKTLGFTTVDSFLLEIKIGEWTFEVFGMNSAGEPASFHIEPIALVTHFMK